MAKNKREKGENSGTGTAGRRDGKYMKTTRRDFLCLSFFLRRFALCILCKIVLRCLIPNRLNTAAAVQVAAKCALPECARLTDAVDKIVAFFMGMIPSLLRFSICPKSIGLAIDHTPPGHLISLIRRTERSGNWIAMDGSKTD